jgi:hypothetical protein
MFMRYRGGGVGHLYMRAIEVWLAETGWGSNDALVSTNDSEEGSEESSDDSEDENGGNPENEVSEDEVSNGTVSSDEEHGSGIDPDAEYASSEDDEETMDGKYGFSSL